MVSLLFTMIPRAFPLKLDSSYSSANSICAQGYSTPQAGLYLVIFDFSQYLHFSRPQRSFWRAALPTIICWEHSKYLLSLIIQFIKTILHRISLRTDPQRTWPISSCQTDFVPSIPLRPEWHAQMKKGAIMALPLPVTGESIWLHWHRLSQGRNCWTIQFPSCVREWISQKWRDLY